MNDKIDIQGAPHTVLEISRESLGTIPEKTDEELYAQPKEEEVVTPPVVPEGDGDDSN